jgi:hypothetical protein
MGMWDNPIEDPLVRLIDPMINCQLLSFNTKI